MKNCILIKEISILIFSVFFICGCQQEEFTVENCSSIGISRGMRVSILGDSYSTFRGFLTPESNATYYPSLNVESVEQTWWGLFIKHNELILECNNSYSGSTIAMKSNVTNSFVERSSFLGNPDLILIFGGTNDSWQRIPLGIFQYSDWTDADLKHFRPAFAYMIDFLQRMYPKSKLVNIINTDLKSEYKRSMEAICRYYQVCNISLSGIEKQEGHPTKKGMYSICKQLNMSLYN